MSPMETGIETSLVGRALIDGVKYFPPSQLYITFSLAIVLFSIVSAKIGTAQSYSQKIVWTKVIPKYGAMAVLVALLAVVELEAFLLVAIISHNSFAAQTALAFNALTILIIFVLMALWWRSNLDWQVPEIPSE